MTTVPAGDVTKEAQPAHECKPALFCRIFGHRWKRYVSQEYRDPEFPDDSWKKTFRVEFKACDRCGTPNPNYEA